METYRNWHPVAYRSSAYAPVPGWGMQPIMAGSRTIAIGGFGYDMPITTPLGTQTIQVPIEDMLAKSIGPAIEQVWPQLQPKLKAELRSSVAEAREEMRRDLVIAAGVVVAAVGLAAWWSKKR